MLAHSLNFCCRQGWTTALCQSRGKRHGLSKTLATCRRLMHRGSSTMLTTMMRQRKRIGFPGLRSRARNLDPKSYFWTMPSRSERKSLRTQNFNFCHSSSHLESPITWSSKNVKKTQRSWVYLMARSKLASRSGRTRTTPTAR